MPDLLRQLRAVGAGTVELLTYTDAGAGATNGESFFPHVPFESCGFLHVLLDAAATGNAGDILIPRIYYRLPGYTGAWYQWINYGFVQATALPAFPDFNYYPIANRYRARPGGWSNVISHAEMAPAMGLPGSRFLTGIRYVPEIRAAVDVTDVSGTSAWSGAFFMFNAAAWLGRRLQSRRPAQRGRDA